MTYKIVIAEENRQDWTNWSGTNHAIINGIVDDMSVKLGHKIRTDQFDIIKSDQELIDYTDDQGVTIANFNPNCKKEK